MRKQLISKADLAGLFRQRMDERAECPRDMQVEIKHVKTSTGPGWTAVTKEADTLAHIDCARFVGALTIELREAYKLSED